MLTLRSGESSLVLAPEIGGAIVGWTFGTVPLLRRPAPDAIMTGNVRGLACFPLVPFSNRIAQRTVPLGRHATTRWTAISATIRTPSTASGWQRAWEVATVGAAVRHADTARMTRPASRPGWPFAFEAEQRFMLAPDALRVALSSCATASSRRHRPGSACIRIFRATESATLRFNATQRVAERRRTPCRRNRCAVPPEWDHSGGQRIGERSARQLLRRLGRRRRASSGRRTAPALRIEADEPFRHLDRLHATRPGLLLRRAGQPHERRDQPDGRRRRTRSADPGTGRDAAGSR